MFQRLLVLAFVAFAVLGLYSPEYADAVVAQAHAADDDGCCPARTTAAPTTAAARPPRAPASASAAVALPPRVGVADLRHVGGPTAAWALGAEQSARDRSSAPPTPPLIG